MCASWVNVKWNVPLQSLGQGVSPLLTFRTFSYWSWPYPTVSSPAQINFVLLHAALYPPLATQVMLHEKAWIGYFTAWAVESCHLMLNNVHVLGGRWFLLERKGSSYKGSFFGCKEKFLLLDSCDHVPTHWGREAIYCFSVSSNSWLPKWMSTRKQNKKERNTRKWCPRKFHLHIIHTVYCM